MAKPEKTSLAVAFAILMPPGLRQQWQRRIYLTQKIEVDIEYI
jgi:hypothetical protein